jgi:hypothetical protein
MPKTAEPLPVMSAPAAPVLSKLSFKNLIRRYRLTVGSMSTAALETSALYGLLVWAYAAAVAATDLKLTAEQRALLDEAG